jgi:predicted transposase YdaD
MATPYDRNFKLLLEDDPRALIELVLELPAECILETYDREINIESLRADHLLRVRMENGESLIHLEALTWYDKGWARSQISKAALITIKYWLPLKSLVVLLTPKRVPKRVAHELVEYNGSFRMHLSVDVVRLWKVSARRALDLGSLALCPWTMLMDSTEDEQREAAARIVASGDRGMAFRMALLGGLRYGNRQEILERLDGMITEEQLKESSFYKEILQEGLAEGLKQGRAEGRAEGRLAGHAEGVKIGKREALVRVLTKRFGRLPAWSLERIESASTRSLNAWMDRAVQAKSLDDVISR